MGQVKKAYMAQTMDDMGVPNDIRKEAILASFTDEELQAELNRREDQQTKELFKGTNAQLNNLITGLKEWRSDT